MDDVEDPGADAPLTVQEVAALQAGLLDDATAARVRRRVRTDPQAQRVLAALDRVRTDVAALGASPAAPVDPALVDGVVAGLRSRPAPRRPGHSAHPLPRPARIMAAVAGGAATVAAIGLGVAALIDAPTPDAPESLHAITVASPPRAAIPLTGQEILALLDAGPDFGPGPLADPHRLASCLTGLHYPDTTRVLGARPIEIRDRRGVLLLLPGERPGAVTGLVVAPDCSSRDTGLFAETVVNRG